MHFNLSVALSDKEQLDDCVAACRQALRLKGDFAEAYSNLGNALGRMGQLDEAIAACRQALRFKPALAAAHFNLANALAAKGSFDEAISACRQTLRLRPDFAEAHSNLGNLYTEKGQLDQAIAAYRHALRLNPDLVKVHSNLGSALRDNGQLDEAIAACRQALQLDPDYADAYCNLGRALCDKGLLDQSIAASQQAIRLAPNHAESHWNYALSLLLQGDFARGWPEYEWRWQTKRSSWPRRNFTQPQWDGQNLNGQAILLHAEQGIGDTIHFVRYAPLVARRGGRVIVRCQPDLARLFKSSPGLGQIIASNEPVPPFDVYCPLLSLPLVFKTDLQSIPASVPYLKADDQLIEAWKRRLDAAPNRFRVGLVWAGNPGFKGDRMRSLTLETLAPFAAVPGVTFFSLQKGSACDQANHPPRGMQLTNLGRELKDFADTAAVMSLMDLIVTTDTSMPHLAGALGRPVWLMLQFVPDFRWMLQREDCPWYPTMRLFRQRSLGDWPDVIRRVAQSLTVSACSAVQPNSSGKKNPPE
jgi:Flp pilus assembly protein TadD